MKKKAYLISFIITIIFIFSTAAVCSLCSSPSEKISAEGLIEKINSSIENQTGTNEDNSQDKNKSEDSQNNSSSSDSTDNSGSQSQENNNNNNDSSNSDAKSGNNPPVINSIIASSNTFLPGQTYAFTSDVTDPDNDAITYDWHIDSGYADTPESPGVNWTMPNSDGLFNISLTVSDGWGGFDSQTMEILVGNAASNPGTVITDIAITPPGGIYTDNTYKITCYISDNIGTTDISFSINSGVLHSQDANIIEWDTPGAPGTCTLNVTVTNKAGDKVSASKDFIVEQTKVEISDIVVLIDYIEAGSSYNLTAVIIDPKGDIASYKWSCSGGSIHDELGYLAGWETPGTPGVYSLTLEAFTFNGATVSRTEEFEVKPPK
ncbi:MAG: PKD domain-containing protein [Actinobacteria bacterium]|nr:PKD domain-containing protein [Actinomycetota bacterium]